MLYIAESYLLSFLLFVKNEFIINVTNNLTSLCRNTINEKPRSGYLLNLSFHYIETFMTGKNVRIKSAHCIVVNLQP